VVTPPATPANLKAAEYSVAVKDLMRAIDKFYNVMFASW